MKNGNNHRRAQEFAATLKKLREESGFKTAYAFFHDSGGKAVFGFSYRMYLAMESGHKIPPFKAVPVLIHCLHMVALSEPAMKLVSAWLTRKLGASAFDLLLKPLLKEPLPPPQSPFQKVLHRSLSDQKKFVTPQEVEVIARNRANYLCWMLMSNDSGKWEPVGLSKQLGISRAAARAALEELCATKLLKRVSGNACKCPFAGYAYEYPRINISEAAKRIRKIQDEIMQDGQEIYLRRAILRADLTELANYMPLLSLNITAVQAYGTTKHTDTTAFFNIETRIVKILDT
ncbi:MAG: hypothetical protein M0011_01560 [Elusimicrobia bacterium]|nr:hypothetical protein [Elusimicrobiota bacterium]